jgi:hypothetical protein
MLASLTTKCMAKSAYEAIKSHWVGVQRVREANVEQLRKEFSEIRFQEGESVDDFSMWKRRVPLARRTRQREQVATLGGLRSHQWGAPEYRMGGGEQGLSDRQWWGRATFTGPERSQDSGYASIECKRKTAGPTCHH